MKSLSEKICGEQIESTDASNKQDLDEKLVNVPSIPNMETETSEEVNNVYQTQAKDIIVDSACRDIDVNQSSDISLNLINITNQNDEEVNSDKLINNGSTEVKISPKSSTNIVIMEVDTIPFNATPKQDTSSENIEENQTAVVSEELHEICEKNLTISENEEQSTEINPEGDSTFRLAANTYMVDEKKLELCRYSWQSTAEKQHYTRGCHWSPDGTCLLVVTNLDGMHIVDLPISLYQNEYTLSSRPVDVLETAIHVKESGTVYDWCWYPFMNSTMPDTCCWITTKQHGPIQLWDAFSGELRATYRGYDNVDEVEAAYSVAFSADAQKVIGGYKKNLKVFNSDIPGRIYTEIPIKQPCVCFATHLLHNDMIATGSWNATINMYDLRNPKLGALVSLFKHKGGVTHLKFSPNGHSLFSGARKDDMLLEWDMRNFSRPAAIFHRNVVTNQRIYFDINCGGNFLASGDTDGIVHIWNLETKKYEYQYPFHNDCCNGVSFHPSRPILATSSGQYHFLDSNVTEEVKTYENSLIFWWTGHNIST